MRISLRSQKKASEPERVPQRRHDLWITLLRSYCHEQCVTLAALDDWATRNDLWLSHKGRESQPRYFALTRIRKGSTSHYLKRYENGRMAVFVERKSGRDYVGNWCSDSNPLFWKWLRTVSSETLSQRANWAALYNRGI